MLEAYAVVGNEVVNGLLVLLSGSAKLRYKNTQTFRQHLFFPPGYHRNLNEQVWARVQGELESFRNFAPSSRVTEAFLVIVNWT